METVSEGHFRGSPAKPYTPVRQSRGPRLEIDRPQERAAMKDDIAPHVHDITRALGGKVSEQEIEKELSNYINVYRVSLDTAKRSIVKKHGGNPAHLSLGIAKTIRELVPGESSVNLLARFVSVNEKAIDSENGARTILYGILGDATATVPFTAWEPLPFEPARGDVVRVQNAYTKEYRGQVQVNLGVRTVVTREAADALPPLPAGAGGAPYAASAKATPVKMVELREGSSNIAFTARVLSVEKREVDVEGGKKTVYSGVLADETAKSQFSAWKDFELHDGDVLRVEGGYVKSWRGIPPGSLRERAAGRKVR